jgi:hypothetical protein
MDLLLSPIHSLPAQSPEAGIETSRPLWYPRYPYFNIKSTPEQGQEMLHRAVSCPSYLPESVMVDRTSQRRTLTDTLSHFWRVSMKAVSRSQQAVYCGQFLNLKLVKHKDVVAVPS